MELANHFGMNHSHYDLWLAQNHPELDAKRYQAVTDKGQQTWLPAAIPARYRFGQPTCQPSCITPTGSPSAR